MFRGQVTGQKKCFKRLQGRNIQEENSRYLCGFLHNATGSCKVSFCLTFKRPWVRKPPCRPVGTKLPGIGSFLFLTG